MVGRPRRASTSSVETVDEDRILWRQETSVLRTAPVDKIHGPEPVFELQDAVVLNKDGHTLENALHVGTRGPYIIRGTLIIDEPEQKTHLIMRVRHSMPIQVPKSNRYSIGEAGEGNPVIWVEGRCAWYEINPSPAYAPIYDKMCEAASLYYRIMDIYKEKKPKKAKKGKKDQLKELHSVFHEELVEKAEERLKNPPPIARSPSVEAKPAAALVAPSLLSSRTRSGSSAPSVARSNATPELMDVQDSPPRNRSTRSRSITQRETSSTVDLPAPSQPQRSAPAIRQPPSVQSVTRTPSVAPASSEVGGPVSNDDITPFQTVVNGVEWVYDQIGKNRKGMIMPSTLNKLFFSYKFPTFKNGESGCHKIPVEELLHYNAQALLQVLDKDKYSGHEFYSWLQGAAERPFVPVALKPSDLPYRLVPRGSRPRPSKATQPLSEAQGVVTSGLEDDLSSTPRSSPAGKSLRRPGRPSGKKSSLRLTTGSKKRLHSDVDSESEDDESRPKRSHYFSDGDEDMEVDAQASSSEDEVPRDGSQEPIKIVIRADKIPSATPHGPNETWVCEEEDCGYVVRGGDVQECQQRIQRHFEQHENQMDRVSLAVTEGTRGHLPINHLMEKLKKLGEKSQAAQQLAVDGVALPQRIKRNLLV
ncbi:uncharacterized protein NECHADRAFT_49001 [Fusarium vanettenii 77-13-4]|uniref:RFTS domain-containing protein n=1 Tax=Fusarium vanettenii (strain ATCC MYA-4622 / CBS 123669 / FGSC 9596 / NRRL 45880 / 77-13-4) TaxID=660122 RepID=C7YU07_FUSV7|nr:uncharacterized protein NECHADRAFT_49001 [Fusarium vanettenii 77-13-4]EEU44331.1 hypothetical protein NECHADRAFT_49001 [Fusarium vanettenii 77-13-4]